MGLYRHRPAPPRRRRPTFPVPWPRALGADFDGTNDYLTRGAGLTGAADGRKGMMSFWVRFTGGDGAFQTIVGSDGDIVQVVRTSGNAFRFNVYSAAIAELMSMTTNGSKTVAAGLMHVLASWDLTAGRAQVYVHDVDDRSSAPTLTDADIDYTRTEWRVGADGDPGLGAKLQGALHELWFSFADSLDLSVEANRRKFITAARGPVDLGTDGSGPTGSAPIIYLRGDHAAFGANSGSGGDLTLTGTLTEPAFRPGVKSLAETTAVIVLVVQDAAHGHAAEQPTLTQAHVLAVAEALHGHAADGVVLTQAHVLVLDDALHGHAADNATLTQAHVLVVADTLHAHAADAPALTQAHVLVVADTAHGHAADNVVLDVSVTLAPDDAAHGHAAEAPTLTQAHVLAVADALHALASESPALTQAHLLAVADALHGHTADNVILSEGALLAPDDASHGHAAESVTLTQAHVLAVMDAVHAHLADAPTLTQAHVLVVSDALHALFSDNVTLAGDGIAVEIPVPGVLVVKRTERVFVVQATDGTLVIVAPESLLVTAPASSSLVIH